MDFNDVNNTYFINDKEFFNAAKYLYIWDVKKQFSIIPTKNSFHVMFEVDGQDIGRIMLNLNTNASYAFAEKKQQQGKNYKPTISVTTKR